MTSTIASTRYQAIDALGYVITDQGCHQRWLSKRVGVDESLIGKIVSGKRTASEKVARRISLSLEVPVIVLSESLDSVGTTLTHTGDT